MIYSNCYHRYTVVLNGKDAIQEALVKHSFDFASRPTFFLDTIFNIGRHGILSNSCCFKIGRRTLNSGFRTRLIFRMRVLCSLFSRDRGTSLRCSFQTVPPTVSFDFEEVWIRSRHHGKKDPKRSRGIVE